MNSTMIQILKNNDTPVISVYESIRDSYINYGMYVNNHRHIPYLLDGLKPVYKRMILSGLKCSDEEKTSSLVGHCMQNYHDHGEKSIEPVVSQLVNIGIFKGIGNHGYVQMLGDDIDSSAARYTKAGVAPGYRKLFEEIIDYVPSFQNEFGVSESMYIPFPLPLICTFGGLGIGVGTGTRLPAFTPRSMLDAYLSDDPLKLVSKYGYEILNEGELIRLWKTGQGTLKLKMKVYKDNDGGAIIEGNPTEYKPDFTELMRWKDDKRVVIQDISTDTQRVKVSKQYRLKFPTEDDVYNEVEKASIKMMSYYMRTTYNNKVYDIGLRDWIDITYNNYLGLLEKKKLDKINKINNEIKIYSSFKDVANLIINKKMSDEAISKKLNLELWIVTSISKKTLATLRDYDPKITINKLKTELSNLEKCNHPNYIKKIIYEL